MFRDKFLVYLEMQDIFKMAFLNRDLNRAVDYNKHNDDKENKKKYSNHLNNVLKEQYGELYTSFKVKAHYRVKYLKDLTVWHHAKDKLRHEYLFQSQKVFVEVLKSLSSSESEKRQEIEKILEQSNHLKVLDLNALKMGQSQISQSQFMHVKAISYEGQVRGDIDLIPHGFGRWLKMSSQHGNWLEEGFFQNGRLNGFGRRIRPDGII